MKNKKIDKIIEEFKIDMIENGLALKLLDIIPYQIEIFDLNGNSVFFNRKMCEEFNINDSNQIVGKYNVLNDPIMEKLELNKMLEKVFEGEVKIVKDVKVLHRDISEHSEEFDENFNEVKFIDINAFPLCDERGVIKYVVCVFDTKQTYAGKQEIIRAEEYMNENWLKDYDINTIAEKAGLSAYYFSKVFKQEIGITPYEYYKNIKMLKLKEKLCDSNINIEKAFENCGINYNSRNLKMFKNKTGLTPIEYQKEKNRIN